MKKADLVRLLAPEPANIRDDPVPGSPETNVPVQKLKLQRVKDYAKSKMNNLVNWIVECIPPKPKVVDRAYNFLKKNIV